MWRLFCLFAFAATMALAQEAADKPAGDKPAAGAKAAYSQVTGPITALDAAAGTLTIKGEAGEIKLRGEKGLRVLIDGDPGKLTALAVNAKAQATYRREGEQPYLVTTVLDEKSIAIAAAEAAGVGATIDAITPAEGNKLPTVSVTTAAGKKRTLALPLTAVILKDGEAAKIDAYKVGDKVTVQIRRAGRVESVKAMADPLSFAAFLSDHTYECKLAGGVNKAAFTVRIEGVEKPLECRLVRGGLVVKDGKVVKLDALADGDTVFIKYATKVKGKAQVQGVFTKADWKLFAERSAQKAQRAAREPKADQPKTPPAAGGAN